MRPSLDDFTISDIDDIISMLHCLESMGDDDNCSACEEIIESYGDLFFVVTIESGGRLIEEDDIRIFQHNLRNRETLSLSSGETDSLLPDLGIETMREVVDEFAFGETDDCIYFFVY